MVILSVEVFGKNSIKFPRRNTKQTWMETGKLLQAFPLIINSSEEMDTGCKAASSAGQKATCVWCKNSK